MGEHSENCTSPADAVYRIVDPDGQFGDRFDVSELSDTAAGKLALLAYRGYDHLGQTNRTAMKRLAEAGLKPDRAAFHQMRKNAVKFGLSGIAPTPHEARQWGRRIADLMIESADEFGDIEPPKVLRPPPPESEEVKPPPEPPRKPRVRRRKPLRADRAAAPPPLRPRINLDDAPVTVLAPSTKPGGLGIVTMRAGTPVMGKNGERTTIRQAMKAQGFEFEPDINAFRAPGAPDEEIMWYDWRDSGMPFLEELTIDKPAKLYWPDIVDRTKRARRKLLDGS